MKMRTTYLLASMMLGGSPLWAEQAVTQEVKEMVAKDAEQPAAEQHQTVEVCFVLDTTGSMGGLIEGAKRKIWSIANQMAQRKPTPTIRFSLIGYRDRSDTYVTKVFDMTDDLDAIHAELLKFQAGGGGDSPESVNQALHEAVTKVKWSDDPKTKKIIFLVGDAPPHMDYVQEIQYPEVCKLAVTKNIVINAIQCGALSSCTEAWKKIATLGKGDFVALPQSGGVVAIVTPQDKEIAELSKKIYSSAVAYGNAHEQKDAVEKQKMAMELATGDVASNAARNACQNVHGRGAYRAFSGNNDLVTEWGNKKVTLENLKREHLPEEFKKLSDEKLVAEINKRIESRKETQEKINALQLQRSAYIVEQAKKVKSSSAGKAFDAEVGKMLGEQLK